MDTASQLNTYLSQQKFNKQLFDKLGILFRKNVHKFKKLKTRSISVKSGCLGMEHGAVDGG